jgi:hypothetical protein
VLTKFSVYPTRRVSVSFQSRDKDVESISSRMHTYLERDKRVPRRRPEYQHVEPYGEGRRGFRQAWSKAEDAGRGNGPMTDGESAGRRHKTKVTRVVAWNRSQEVDQACWKASWNGGLFA